MMQVKRYVVSDMAEAMQRIKADLGPNAVILHTQRVQPQGLAAWFRKPGIEVLAAAEGAAAEPALMEPPAKPSVASGTRPPASSRTLTRPETPTAATTGELDLRQELAQVKAALSTLSGSLQAAGLVRQIGAGTPLRQLELVLMQAGVTAPSVQEIVRAVADELSPRAQRDPLAVLDSGRRQLRRRAITADMFGTSEVSRDQPAAICLVGATGVGKTTALTKLAAGLRDRYTVGLVTTDTYGVAAATQLLAYCEILGLPAATAYTPSELAEQCTGLAAKGIDLILVDTPGRNPRSQDQLEELRTFLKAVPNKAIHLVVSASTSKEDMLQIARHFSTCPLHGLVLTKTDEAEHLGAAFNLMLETGLPFTFVSTGQRVPEDLCQATPERIADLILPPETSLGDSEQP